jgi:Protein of unknown function (DUF2789)
METPMHSINSLFAQLGLPSDQTAVEHFIKAHSPLLKSVALSDAPFWTPVQASFLREELLNDADWAEVIDELNARMHT